MTRPAYIPSYHIELEVGATPTNHRWLNDNHLTVMLVEFGALPNATTKNVAHGVSGGFTELIGMDAVAQHGTNQITILANHADRNDAASCIDYYVDDDDSGNITIVTGFNWSAYSVVDVMLTYGRG